MKRPRRATISEKTFGFRVDLFTNTPQATALRRCAAVMELDTDEPENAPDEYAAAWAFCNGCYSCIWIADIEDSGSLVHELYHCVQHFLRHIDSKDEETGAYLLGYFYKHARAKLSKK